MKQLSFYLTILAFFFTACSEQQQGIAQKVKGDVVAIKDYIKGKKYDKYEVATFAGGCFWCTEAAFERINGVKDVISGYSGGTKDYPTYRQVGNGSTGHTEAIQIYYDPTVVSFETLLEVLIVAHDPTQLNRQGPDVGEEYRSAIYYHNESQQKAVAAFIKKTDAAKIFSNPIVTEVAAFKEFWVAEEYHQNYYELHPENPYVQNISRPKVEKVKKEFKDILKADYK